MLHGCDESIEKSGGCVIDSAKAIAFGVKLPSSEDVWHNSYMKAEYSIREALSLGVVLTIPSAGSESSLGSVITDAEHGFMRAVNNGTIVSKFVVIDPHTSSAL
ncbi:iron-containing alcohol dehydrogenase [Sphaerochaeta globosa]|uniref:iron-containing alcohol dehydrogenase n=1 Tax=Sphaerochaeta globosa TaxID=1131703 RepID=UPI000311C1A9|nr:iron-containing alcohol dehydrogenase [Sphaerochaeta globosa]